MKLCEYEQCPRFNNALVMESTRADVFCIGESPAYSEHLTGYPFTGILEVFASRCRYCSHARECFSRFFYRRAGEGRVCESDTLGNDLALTDVFYSAGQILDMTLLANQYRRPHWDRIPELNLDMTQWPTVECGNPVPCWGSLSEKPSKEMADHCYEVYFKPLLDYYPPERRIILGAFALAGVTRSSEKISITKHAGTFIPEVGWLSAHPSYIVRSPGKKVWYNEVMSHILQEIKQTL